MTIDHWIKIKEQAEELIYSDPDVFLIMSLLMFEARKNIKSKYTRKKLPPGQALITRPSHMSDRRWRDAKDRIEHEYLFATFKGTNKGTVGSLTNTEFCDLNIIIKDEQNDEPRTNKGRTKDEPAQETFSEHTYKKIEEDKNLSYLSVKNFKSKFNENWATIAEQEIPNSKFVGTELEKLVAIYKMPENKVREWLDFHSIDYIVENIKYLKNLGKQTKTGKLLTEMELALPDSPTLYVMLCTTEFLPLIQSALNENYAANNKKTKEKNNPTKMRKVKSKFKLNEDPKKFDGIPAIDVPDYISQTTFTDKELERIGLKPSKIEQLVAG